jgi:hypothetical protein
VELLCDDGHQRGLPKLERQQDLATLVQLMDIAKQVQ